MVLPQATTSHQEEWTGSLPPTRPPSPTNHSRPQSPPTRPHTPNTRPVSPQSTHPHSPNSVQSGHELKQFHHEPQITSQDLKPLQQDVKPFSEHFLALSAGLPAPPRAHHSQPATRSSSPAPISLPASPQNLHHPQNNARTPPPKRWKRSFDLARNEMPIDDSEEARGREEHERDERTDDRSMDGRREQHQHLHSTESNDFVESDAKRFCESKPRGADRYGSMEGEKRFVEADSPMKRFVEPGSRVLSYPHSMPASPTMMDGRNHASLSLLRYPPHESHYKSTTQKPYRPFQAPGKKGVCRIFSSKHTALFSKTSLIFNLTSVTSDYKNLDAADILLGWEAGSGGSRWRWRPGRRTTTPSTTGSRRTPMR